MLIFHYIAENEKKERNKVYLFVMLTRKNIKNFVNFFYRINLGSFINYSTEIIL